MAIAIEEYEQSAQANGEIRFITLELMKLASEQNRPYEQVLKEFVANASHTKRAFLEGTQKGK
ncbi:hypothetical protein HY995_01015 [Candidatus Micrarchaeota archaeon]|nr:hypothetical protein [Candidatus Micrarchaeota archaeon]MBI5176648.1 hypothetical protein [Candidatus Micrarchaeota archaeon]